MSQRATRNSPAPWWHSPSRSPGVVLDRQIARACEPFDDDGLDAVRVDAVADLRHGLDRRVVPAASGVDLEVVLGDEPALAEILRAAAPRPPRRRTRRRSQRGGPHREADWPARLAPRPRSRRPAPPARRGQSRSAPRRAPARQAAGGRQVTWSPGARTAPWSASRPTSGRVLPATITRRCPSGRGAPGRGRAPAARPRTGRPRTAPAPRVRPSAGERAGRRQRGEHLHY